MNPGVLKSLEDARDVPDPLLHWDLHSEVDCDDVLGASIGLNEVLVLFIDSAL